MTDKFDEHLENKEEFKPAALENRSRRKAVKTIVGGVTALAAYHVLPVRWGTPIIEQVFLPAHAGTSGGSLSDPCTVTVVDGYQDSNTVVIRVTGFVTPPTANVPVTIVATGNPDATATATVNTTTAADGTFSSTITLNTTTGIGSVAVKTAATGADGSANCSVNIPQRFDPPEVWNAYGRKVNYVDDDCPNLQVQPELVYVDPSDNTNGARLVYEGVEMASADYKQDINIIAGCPFEVCTSTHWQIVWAPPGQGPTWPIGSSLKIGGLKSVAQMHCSYFK